MKGINENTPMAKLMGQFAHEGKVTWIGLRPGREQPVKEVIQTEAMPGKGLEGDRFSGSAASARQVTLIQAEHISALASLLRRESLSPGLLRRNIVVEGINLLALKDKPFRIGTDVFEMTGLCHPCSKMEKALGHGGYNAMRGHGGITAGVVQPGTIQVGDSVSVLDTPS